MRTRHDIGAIATIESAEYMFAKGIAYEVEDGHYIVPKRDMTMIRPGIEITYDEAILALNALTGRVLALKARREGWTRDEEVIKSFDEDIRMYGNLQQKLAKHIAQSCWR